MNSQCILVEIILRKSASVIGPLSLVSIRCRSPATNRSLVLHASWLSVIGQGRLPVVGRSIFNALSFQLFYVLQFEV